MGNAPKLRFAGFGDAFLAMFSMVLVPQLVLFVALWREKARPDRHTMPDASRLMLRAAAVSLLLVVVAVLVVNSGNVSAHWMLPWTLWFLCGVFPWSAEAIDRKACAS